MKKMVFGKGTKLSRRKFIVGSAAAAGGGLALGLNVPFGIGSAQAQGAATEVNIWVAIKPDDICVIRIARSEMGQGTLTGLAQLVAEELECDWKKVTTEGITPGRNLASKRAWGEMGTGGSRGIRTSQDYVRRGGAAARMMLLQAAADQWKVPVGELTVSEGVITHAASKRSIRYGKVAAQGSEGLEDRRQAAQAARYEGQARWQQGLRHRPQTAGHAQRRDQGLPGVRRQAQELRREQDRRHAWREEGGEGEGHRRRGCRRHLVARQEGARGASDCLG
jgi:CO/xanthine dehydrogenase Mo-binding subunit